MGHYKSNLRDLEFNLFEVFNRQGILGSDPYSEIDEDIASCQQSGNLIGVLATDKFDAIACQLVVCIATRCIGIILFVLRCWATDDDEMPIQILSAIDQSFNEKIGSFARRNPPDCDHPQRLSGSARNWPVNVGFNALSQKNDLVRG